MVDYGRAVPHSAWLRDKPQRSEEFSSAPSGENTSATDTHETLICLLNSGVPIELDLDKIQSLDPLVHERRPA